MSDPPSWIVDETEAGAHAESAAAAVDACLGCSGKCCCCARARACAGAAARAVRAVTVESSRAIEQVQLLGPGEADVLITICTLLTSTSKLSPFAIGLKVCCGAEVDEFRDDVAAPTQGEI